ncbi:glucose-6-phosphate dehydrogenase [Candidatus Liberibacter sp.]|uniref:glucose-6-phosphate dehydrogenase n=1 Tax=Candidatus Liberibacter sp. TaxID=34022 RepID=UPI0015F3BDDD|nr:glucose-6-phosphate dehydrogenase [Candidatus Liberibacter sp.]MBA5723535.1 glucose-6-phosphate dehydrogenase [Candidatus Liberibacter sp.]
MQNQTTPIENFDCFDCIVFGGTGDLVRRKLFPALYNCMIKENFKKSSRIIGISRTKMTTDSYRTFIDQELKKHLKDGEYNHSQTQEFLSHLFYVSLNIEKNHEWAILKELLETNAKRIRVFYLAVSSEFFKEISQKIHANKLITPSTRVVIEKPIGHSLSSARSLNKTISQIFKEDQIFRIDHYLGKESVQGLMVLRFANTLYESLWNTHHIDHIQITTAETIGIENRIDYYNKTGALRDMIQNHILQILCLVAMETPASIDPNAIHNEKIKVLKALKMISPENVQQLTVRGQYRSGIINGLPAKGYLETIPTGISDTETFVSIKAEIKNWRWAGVPFYLRTGKHLAQYVSEIVISFKPVPHSVFGDNFADIKENKLVIRLQPNGGIKQLLMTKDPGVSDIQFKQIALDVCFAEAFKVRNPDGYERLMMDVIRANQTLFMRYDEVEEAWRWADSILQSWQNTKQKVESYAAGTWGPKASKTLIERDGRQWHENT